MSAVEPVAVASRLPTLTALRFFAALLVFLFHAQELFVGTPLEEATRRLGRYGGTGVTFFFVLSGFVLTWGHAYVPGAWRFVAGRLGRIWPLHAVTWVAAVGLAAIGLGEVGSTRGAVAALFLAHAWIPGPEYNVAANGVSWTLSDELFFYAMFPVLVGPILRLSGRGRLLLLVALLALAAGIQGLAQADPDPRGWGWFGYFSPPGRLPEFVLGIVLAAHVRRRGAVPFGLFAGVGVALGTYVAVSALDAPRLPATVVIPAYAILILGGAGADLDPLRRSIDHPVLVRLGEISFAFYLIHQSVLKVCGKVGDRVLGHDAVEALWAAGSGLAISLALSYGLWHRVEAPAYRAVRARLARGPRVPPATEAEPVAP